MLDPIQAVSMNRLIDSSNIQETRQTQETKTDQTTQSYKSSEDSVSISFNLYGDLNKLSESLNIVNQQVKTQLEKYFGIVKDSNKTKEDFLPKEDSSAQDIKEFYNPANTAKRIVDFTTGFFSQYMKNHTDKSEKDNMDGFITLTKNAIDKGFEQAKQTLGDFDKLGDIGANIKETYKRIVKGIEEYQQKYLAKHNIDTQNTDQTATPTAVITDSTAAEEVIPTEERTVIPL